MTRATLPHCCRFVLRLKKGRRLKICTARVATKLKNVKAAVVPFFCTSPLLLLSCGPSNVQVLNRKFLGSKTFVSSDHAEDTGRNHSLCPVYQVSGAPPSPPPTRCIETAVPPLPPRSWLRPQLVISWSIKSSRASLTSCFIARVDLRAPLHFT